MGKKGKGQRRQSSQQQQQQQGLRDANEPTFAQKHGFVIPNSKRNDLPPEYSANVNTGYIPTPENPHIPYRQPAQVQPAPVISAPVAHVYQGNQPNGQVVTGPPVAQPFPPPSQQPYQTPRPHAPAPPPPHHHHHHHHQQQQQNALQPIVAQPYQQQSTQHAPVQSVAQPANNVGSSTTNYNVYTRQELQEATTHAELQSHSPAHHPNGTDDDEGSRQRRQRYNETQRTQVGICAFFSTLVIGCLCCGPDSDACLEVCGMV